MKDAIKELKAGLMRLPRRGEPGDGERGADRMGRPLPGDCFVLCWPNGIQVKPSSHRRAQVNVCVRGEFTMALKDRLLRLRTGEAALVAPFEFHHYGKFTPEEGVKNGMLWAALYFDVADEEVMHALSGKVARLSAEAWRRLGQVLACYQDRLDAGEVGGGRAGEAGAWMDLFLRELARGVGRGGGRAMGASRGAPAAVRAAVKHVHARLHEEIDLESVAESVGVSESHLRRMTKEALGMGLGEFVRRSRLTRAAALLQQADAPRVTEVAEACGFSSVYAFSRAFRTAHGVSPRGFRARMVAGGGRRLASG